MKKFVSMAMVAAMTTSMVPATAFAAGDVTASASIVEALELTKDAAAKQPVISGATHENEVPELRLKITDAIYKTGTADSSADKEATVKLTLDGAEWATSNESVLEKLIEIAYDGTRTSSTGGSVNTETWNDLAVGTPLPSGVTEDQIVWNKLTSTSPDTPSEIEVKDKDVKAIDNAKDAIDLLKTLGGTISTDLGAGDLVYAEATGMTFLTAAEAPLNKGDIKGTPVVDESTVEVVGTVASGVVTGDIDTIISLGDKAYEDFEDGTLDSYFFLRTGAPGSYTYTALTAANRQNLAFGTANVKIDSWGLFEDTTELTQAQVEQAYLDAGYERGYITTVSTIPSAKPDAEEIEWKVDYIDEEEIEITFYGMFAEDDVIYIDLYSELTKTNKGHTATVSVEGDLVEVEDLVYVSVLGEGITASTKKLTNIAEEEWTTLEKDLKIKSAVGNFYGGQTIELKLSNGFEFTNATGGAGSNYTLTKTDDDTAEILVKGSTSDEIVIDADDIEIEATSAKAGDVATIRVKATANPGFNATTTVEVAKVVDYTVLMSVEEDEDVPVIYSGVNVDNDGITDDSDHLSLEVTIEESFPGAWSMRKGFNMELPDGVYVTDVEVISAENFEQNGKLVADQEAAWETAFWNAYQEGDHKGFEFEKRTFDDVDEKLNAEPAEVKFQLELVADPTFYGDVNLKLTGDLVDEQEVTVATFAPIAVVEAEQNDLKIDYRYTEVPTEIKVTETEAGLWEEGSEFWVAVDKADYIEFEDEATFEVTGGMEIDDFEDDRYSKSEDEFVNSIGFEVEEESDEAATVTISNMSLFMQRNIPAGAYDLTAGATAFGYYLGEQLFAPDCDTTGACKCNDEDNDCFISDVEDFSDVVKEAFINVVTAGREQDDASFTTKVVVPVGESYIVAGEKTVELDVPAYVSAAGYTMLPVRAVATALGINNNNVIWNGESKTVTILYGQRIITMVAGQKVINVNGSAIPASAAVEITDGRTFLPMRDLATALGVTDITWDAATKTATLNGGVVAE